MRYVHGTVIRGQWGQVEVWEVVSMKLVEEVCNFLREVAQLTKLAEPHLISAHCSPAPATSMPPNQCCDSPRLEDGGLSHAGAALGPRYCSGCRGSGPDPGPRPARPCQTTTCPLAEVPPSLDRIRVSHAASRRPRSPHLRRRFELDNEIIIRRYATLYRIITYCYLG